MKRVLTSINEPLLPKEIADFIRGAEVYDSSCSPEARVYFIDKDCGYYLKRSKAGSLSYEAELDGYFHSLSLGPRVLSYSSGKCDFLLTEKLCGEDLTYEKYLSEPKKLATLLGSTLRALHEINPIDCPRKNRLEEYIKAVGDNHRLGLYDPSYSPKRFPSAEAAYREFLNAKNALSTEVLIHGDYCLPNIILNGWELSGFIDLGASGIADRHIDVFWGAWTLNFNLKTDSYRDAFYDAYGRDKIDKDLVEIIGIAECFA